MGETIRNRKSTTILGEPICIGQRLRNFRMHNINLQQKMGEKALKKKIWLYRKQLDIYNIISLLKNGKKVIPKAFISRLEKKLKKKGIYWGNGSRPKQRPIEKTADIGMNRA